MRIRTGKASLLAVIIVVIGIPVQAEAITASPVGTLSWGSPTTISGSGTASQLSISSDQEGNDLAVWAQTSGSTSSVYAAVRPHSSSSFEAAQQVFTSSTYSVDSVNGAVKNGVGVIAFKYYAGSTSSVRTYSCADVTASCSWSMGGSATTSSSVYSQVKLGVGASGDVIVAWSATSGSAGESLKSLHRRAGSSSWTSQTLYTTAVGDGLNLNGVGIDGVGNATVAFTYWTDTRPSESGGVEKYLYQLGATYNSFTAATKLSSNSDGQNISSYVDLAVNDDGDAALVWEQYSDANTDGPLRKLTRSGSSGSFGSSGYASDSTEEVGASDVGIDEDGYTTAAYSATYGSNKVVRARDSRSAAPQTVSDVQTSSPATVAVSVNPDNDAMGTWIYEDEVLVTARGESDAVFGSASNISDESELTSLSGSDITVHSDGTAVAGWLGQDASGNTLVQTARYSRHLSTALPLPTPVPVGSGGGDTSGDGSTSGSTSATTSGDVSTSNSGDTTLGADTSSQNSITNVTTSNPVVSPPSSGQPAPSSITLKLSVPKQKAAKRGKLLVYLTCVGGPCKAALVGKCKIGKSRFVVKLNKQLAAGKKTKAYLKMSKRLSKKLRSSVRARKRIKLQLSAKASGLSGAIISGNLTAKKNFSIRN